MAKRRGFFAELNYQAQQAEKRRNQEQAVAFRAHAAAEREAERARKAAERARASVARASVAEQKAAEKEASRLHVESQLAEVAACNADLASQYEQIDGLLASTLDVDDYVDLEDLKVKVVEHPAFAPGRLGIPLPPAPEPVYPPEPVFNEPPAPGKAAGVFGGKRRHQEEVERARADFELTHAKWQEEKKALEADYVRRQEQRDDQERERVTKLRDLEEAYRRECEQRAADAEAHNERISKLINELAFDVEPAIQEYVGIVLSNSVYPEVFPVSHDYEFSLASRELTLTASVPEPAAVPAVKEYKYVKAKDEIVPVALTLKAQKDRYASAVAQVAVRTLHEVFEADRAGKIHSIALTVGVDRISPATGRPETVPLVAVAADRETFAAFDLANVVPEATLGHLGAATSKSPYDLVPADLSRGVRVRGK